jgi:hypothetical protein
MNKIHMKCSNDLSTGCKKSKFGHQSILGHRKAPHIYISNFKKSAPTLPRMFTGEGERGEEELADKRRIGGTLEDAADGQLQSIL